MSTEVKIAFINGTVMLLSIGIIWLGLYLGNKAVDEDRKRKK